MRQNLSRGERSFSYIAKSCCLAILFITLPCVAHAKAVSPVDTHAAPTGDLSAPYHALMQGRIDEAVSALRNIVAAKPADGPAYLLLCRSFYAEEQPDEAINACEGAVQDMPRDSDALDWLGRADGMKANLAGPISGLTLARKVRESFEAAVALAPMNGAAVNDLSEFYISAPALIGGGSAKAEALADRVQGQLPQEAHRIRALAAEKRKDYGTAEREFKAAVGVANHPNAWADLGDFYKRRGENDRAVDTLKKCLALDRAEDATVVDVASVLIAMGREPRLANQTLRSYLNGDAQSDAAPVIKVYVMLGKLLSNAGDKQEAKIEFERSLKLAANYGAAKDALQEP